MRRVNSWVSSFVFGLFIAVLPGCGGGGDDGFSGASASLTWNPVQSAVSYTVHYGKQSSERGGSCNYENSVDVSEAATFITGLDFNTQYYFARQCP